MQLGASVVPKSRRGSRLVENAAVFDFALSAAEMQALLGVAAGVAEGGAAGWRYNALGFDDAGAGAGGGDEGGGEEEEEEEEEEDERDLRSGADDDGSERQRVGGHDDSELR